MDASLPWAFGEAAVTQESESPDGRMRAAESGQASLSDWLRVLKIVWSISPARVVALIGTTLVGAIIPSIQVALTAAAVQAVVDGVSDPSSATSSILTVGSLLILTAAVGHLSATAAQYLNQIVRMRLTFVVSGLVMEKGTQLELEDYENAEVYDLLQRAFQETNGSRLHELFDESLTVLRETITIVSVGAVLLSFNLWIGVAILLAPIPAAVAQLQFGKRMFELEYARAEQRREQIYYQQLTTMDMPFKEVRLFNLGTFFIDRYRVLISRFLKQDAAVTRKYMLNYALLGLVSVLIATGAMVAALFQSLETQAVGQLAGYLQAIVIVQGAISGVTLGVAGIVQNTLFLTNLFRLLDLPTGKIRDGELEMVSTAPSIEFRGVTFTYPGTERPAIEDVSFQVAAGETLAIVGENGSGKTTLVKLLSRLYEPTSGTILIDGISIAEYDLDSLRSRMGVIFQDFIKYELSVRDNVGIGDVGRMDDDVAIVQAISDAGMAGARDNISQDLDVRLGRHFSGGKQLSGGQWQKVATARAFFRNASIVVLDEPSASLDPRAEEELFARLTEVVKNATAIFIAHRFSTVRRADRIVVLDSGKVVESGSHDQLITKEGLYSELFELQAENYR